MENTTYKEKQKKVKWTEEDEQILIGIFKHGNLIPSEIEWLKTKLKHSNEEIHYINYIKDSSEEYEVFYDGAATGIRKKQKSQ